MDTFRRRLITAARLALGTITAWFYNRGWFYGDGWFYSN